MKKIILLIFALVFLISCEKELSFEERREIVLSDLSEAIEEAEEQGRYRCCIEPACTMCYMGSWIWKDGSCYCDDMIKEGKDDKVCPQCVRGIEEGLCKSTIEEGCDVNRGENFKAIY